MPEPSPELEEPADPPDSRPAATIAHRAGNHRRLLARALRAQVDLIEADIWLHRGRLVARHARALGSLPIHYDRWYVKPVFRRLLTLDDLVHLTRDHATRLFLDIKGMHPGVGNAVVETLAQHDALDGVAVCSQIWEPLDEIAALAPQVDVYYSLGHPEQMPRLWGRLGHDPDFHAVSINHRLLSPDTMARIKEHEVRVFAWTEDNPSRAKTLLSWGADGIISNNLALLSGLHHGKDAEPRGPRAPVAP